MSMNIKSEEAHRLARELAALTGESLTAALTTALRVRLAQVREEHGGQSRLARMHAIAEDVASRFHEPWKSIDHGELLYDEETGLPK